KGKVSYMAPEQTRGEAADRRADVFAAGVMLWEAITGRRLWRGANEMAILHERLTTPVPSARSLVPSVPEELDRIAMRALAHDPDGGYMTGDEMRADLGAFVHATRAPAVTSRELGGYIADLFGDERARTHALVVAQLGAMQAAADPRSVDLLRLPLLAIV